MDIAVDQDRWLRLKELWYGREYTDVLVTTSGSFKQSKH